MAEVSLTVFQRMIEKYPFPKNAFYKKSKNGGNSNAATIEIPQSSASEEPVLGGVNAGYYTTSNNNTSATALTPVIRVNDKLTYNNTIIRLPNPIVLETLQEAALSYNKAANLAEQEGENMNTAIANYLAIQFAADVADYIVPTTGLDEDGTVNKRSASGTTGAKGGYAGLVKRFEYEDLLALEVNIKKQNLDGGTWYALPSVEQWDDMRRIQSVIDYDKSGNANMLDKGIMGRFGSVFFLDPRQNDRWNANVLYDITTPAAPVPVAYGGALNANCVSAMIVWNDKYVERNEGSVVFFSQKKDPTYMGDIYNWGVRCGGSYRRSDGRGTIAIYEAPTT